jgi:RimJ/RimL family protein N-acetyltransferase
MACDVNAATPSRGPGAGAPCLQTPRLTIRAFEPGDIDAFMAYRNDLAWMRFQGFKGLSRAQYERALLAPQAAAEGMQLAVVETATGNLIGDLYVKVEQGTAMIGYTVSPTNARRGFAREAVQALLAWLAQSGLCSVQADVLPGNTASLRLLGGLGFGQTGETAEGELRFARAL